MAETADAPERPEDAGIEVECEHCGHAFRISRVRQRKEPCPACGQRTLVPLQRAPVWWLAVFGAALLAVAIPGLTFRFVGPLSALAVAVIALASLWMLGRRL